MLIGGQHSATNTGNGNVTDRSVAWKMAWLPARAIVALGRILGVEKCGVAL